MHDWIQRYPKVQRLLQQPDDVIEGLMSEDDASRMERLNAAADDEEARQLARFFGPRRDE